MPNVYSPSGVCSPSRASLALGMYPSAIGANHMRTSSHTDITGLPAYEAVPPPQAKMLSQYLRSHGYYTTNNYKTDYQFKAPKNAWDDSGIFAHWRNRPQGKPFFSVVNFTTTHESGQLKPIRLFISLRIQIFQFRHICRTPQSCVGICGRCIITLRRQISRLEPFLRS